jgi:hypothetical protein
MSLLELFNIDSFYFLSCAVAFGIFIYHAIAFCVRALFIWLCVCVKYLFFRRQCVPLLDAILVNYFEH